MGIISVRCPHCRQHNLVTRRSTHYWTCFYCYLRFSAPGARKR